MFTLKLGPKPVKLIHVSEILTSWDPDLTRIPHRTYVDVVEAEEIRQLREQITALEYRLQNERDQAFEQGYRDGGEAVSADVKALMQRLPVQYSQMVEGLKEQLNEELKKVREPLLDFSLGVAEQIIGKAVAEEDTLRIMLRKNVEEFMDKVRTQTRIIIRVNPEQIDWIVKSDIVEIMNAGVREHVRFIRDITLKPGEAILETEDFIIEGIVQKQLAHLKEQLTGGGDND